MAASGIRAGRLAPRHWADGVRPVDVFDAKADVLALLAAQGAPVDRLGLTTDAPAWYHPGRSGVFRLGPKQPLAAFGELHPRVLQLLGAKAPMVAFEVFLEAIPPARAKGTAKPALVCPLSSR